MDLTEEQIAEEVRMIDMEAGWPVWPVLPVKNIHRGAQDYPRDKEVGITRAIYGLGDREPKNLSRRIYFINLFELKTGTLGPQLQDVPFEDFENTEAMVRAGWIGD